MYKLFLKPFLFAMAPEKAHYFTVGLLKFTLAIPGISWLFKSLYAVKHPSLERNFLGLNFKNPVGLAAGFDKDGKFFEPIAALGFGFVEIGTVTPKPQEGNPKPRLFRLPKDHGLINRMGFNNEGIDAFVQRIKNRKDSDVIIGGNIGKNKVTPNENAADDYLICFEKLFPYVDYFVVNVSSPNTPNLRDLQDKEPLTRLLNLLQEKNKAKSSSKPILLKIAPDLTDSQLDDILEIVADTKIQGVIATNTTIARAPLKTSESEIKSIGPGGLSGAPLSNRSTEVIRYLSSKSGGKLFIIGVGGINSAEDAQEKIDAGASLVQVYSGMVFQGPSLIKSINKALIN